MGEGIQPVQGGKVVSYDAGKVIGYRVAQALTQQAYAYPFFTRENQLERIGDGPDKNVFVKHIALAQKPSDGARRRLKFPFWGDETEFEFADLKGRGCKHYLLPRIVIDNVKFITDFNPTFEDERKEEEKYAAGTYSSLRPLIHIRKHGKLSRIISTCSEPYSLLCKFKTKFELGNTVYDAEMPLLFIPGASIDSDSGRCASLFCFQQPHMLFRSRPTKGFHHPTMIGMNTYEEATGDKDFNLHNWPELFRD